MYNFYAPARGLRAAAALCCCSTTAAAHGRRLSERANGQRAPLNYAVDALWAGALEASAAKHGATWLHHLHLGIGALEAVHVPAPSDAAFGKAQAHFEQSLALKPTAEAHRALARRGGAVGGVVREEQSISFGE